MLSVSTTSDAFSEHMGKTEPLWGKGIYMKNWNRPSSPKASTPAAPSKHKCDQIKRRDWGNTQWLCLQVAHQASWLSQEWKAFPQMENGSRRMGGLGSDRLESGLKAAADKALHVLKAQQPVPKVLGGPWSRSQKQSVWVFESLEKLSFFCDENDWCLH